VHLLECKNKDGIDEANRLDSFSDSAVFDKVVFSES